MKEGMRSFRYMFVSIALCLFFFVGWAQSVDRNEIIREMGEPVLFGEIYPQQPQVHGTPFFVEEWQRGNIYLANGTVAAGKMLKYNGLTDQLHWFDGSRNVTIILDKAPITGFSMEDPHSTDHLVFRKIVQGLPVNDGESGIFLQVLYEGDFSLYVHRNIEERGRRVVHRNDRRVELPNLEAHPVYYVNVPGEGLVEVRRMRKSFLYGLVPGSEDAIRQALAGHPSRLRNERTLTAAIEAVDKI
jgi:hypothetical protein